MFFLTKFNKQIPDLKKKNLNDYSASLYQTHFFAAKHVGKFPIKLLKAMYFIMFSDDHNKSKNVIKNTFYSFICLFHGGAEMFSFICAWMMVGKGKHRKKSQMYFWDAATLPPLCCVCKPTSAHGPCFQLQCPAGASSQIFQFSFRTPASWNNEQHDSAERYMGKLGIL